jgi:hypothetical protein
MCAPVRRFLLLVQCLFATLRLLAAMAMIALRLGARALCSCFCTEQRIQGPHKIRIKLAVFEFTLEISSISLSLLNISLNCHHNSTTLTALTPAKQQSTAQSLPRGWQPLDAAVRSRDVGSIVQGSCRRCRRRG